MPNPHLTYGDLFTEDNCLGMSNQQVKNFCARLKINGDCWEWTGAKSDAGHGRVRINKILYRAHRVTWMLVHGPIKEGLFVCHKCNNPACCNPPHLYLGTCAENTQHAARDGLLKRRGKMQRNVLTPDDVRAIRALRGIKTQTEVAKMFGVTPNNISKIQLRRIYSYVE